MLIPYIHLVSFSLTSVTLRSRRNPTVIDRTPRPTLEEVRKYFIVSLRQYLERHYIQNFDVFLTLCEEYVTKTYVQDRMVVVEKLLRRFLDSESPEYIHMDPSMVRSCQVGHNLGPLVSRHVEFTF